MPSAGIGAAAGRVGRGGPALPTAVRFGLVAVPIGFLAVFFAWPVGAIIARGLTARGVRDVLGDPGLRSVAWFTLWQAAASTALTLAIGLLPAYVLSHFRFRGRAVMLALVTVPFVLPTVVVGAAFLALLPVSLDQTVWAILIAHVYFNLAVVIRSVGTFWGQLDPRVEEAARTLGASPIQVLGRVTLPLLRPALMAAASIVFLFTFTSFGIIRILGGPRHPTIEVEIWRLTTQAFALPAAAALAFVQLLAVSALMIWWSRAQARHGLTLRLRPAGHDVAPRTVGQRLLVAGTVAGLAAVVLLPLGRLVIGSFTLADGYGLGAWRALGASGGAGPSSRPVADPLGAIATSLRFAVIATALAVLIGGAAACAIAYARRGGHLVDAGLMLPLGTSAVTVGFGLVITMDRRPLDLRGSWVLIPIAHAVVAIPFVVRAVLPTLRAIDPRLRDVASTLGAPPGRVWREIDLPFLRRALVAGAGFAFAISLGEFGATSFLTRVGDETMPIAIGRLLGRPSALNLGQANALATVLMTLTLFVVLAVDRFPRRRDRLLMLDVVGVRVRFGTRSVLDGVDLHVGPGEVVGLLGPSGSGKSTLLRVIAGLLIPEAGQVWWDGQDVSRVPPHRRRFGLVFQDHQLFPHRDVGANVGFGLTVAGRPKDQVRARVADLLDLVGLTGFERRSVTGLSGGEAQRVALARVLAPEPRLLLLDEPLGALDRELHDRLAADLRTLLKEIGMAGVHVTHDREEAEVVADRVVTLDELASGPGAGPVGG